MDPDCVSNERPDHAGLSAPLQLLEASVVLAVTGLVIFSTPRSQITNLLFPWDGKQRGFCRVTDTAKLAFIKLKR